MSAFLTAEWHNVLAVTYPVDEALLQPYLPPGCEIDQLGGAARLSLVAFEFVHTRVKGLPIPGHTTFPEVNLRFYVRHRGERGVVFIRELVPRAAVARLARWLFNEPYVRVPMRVQTRQEHRGVRVVHRFGERYASSLTVLVQPAGAAVPTDGSDEHWLTHHHLGFGRTRRGHLHAYRVEHPLWALAPVFELDLSIDFERVYGSTWAWIADRAPSHVTFALGSRISIAAAKPR